MERAIGSAQDSMPIEEEPPFMDDKTLYVATVCAMAGEETLKIKLKLDKWEREGR